MNNAELYQKNNSVQKEEALQCLVKYANKINWKKSGYTVIDIGSGDGSVTSDILKNFLPNNCKELLGCDLSENMVQFANAHHAKDFIRFTVLDIGGELPNQFREKFDHAFSFYALNWVKNQEMAFSNIYNLLANGGDCLLLILVSHPVFNIWRNLARTIRWNSWLKDVDHFISPYYERQDPEKEIKRMMKTIGFTNIEVKCLQKAYVFSSIEVFQNAMRAVNPFKIPLEMQEDFWEDFDKVVRDMDLVDHTNNNVDGTLAVKINYKVIIISGKK